MIALLFVLIATAGLAAAQSFTPADASMSPLLEQGQSYSYVVPAAEEVNRGAIGVLERDGQQYARRIVARPTDRRLGQDTDFILLGQTQKIIEEYIDNRITFFDAADRALLQMHLDLYRAAPALGDSLFFVHALNRPAIAEGQARTAAQGADSREWGLVHARDFVGVIQAE